MIVKDLLAKIEWILDQFFSLWRLFSYSGLCSISPGFLVCKLRSPYTCYRTIFLSFLVNSRNVAETQGKDPLSGPDEVSGDVVKVASICKCCLSMDTFKDVFL